MSTDISKDVEEYFKCGKKKLLKIVPNMDYTLTLYYTDSKRVYDMSTQLYGVFECLKDIEKFYGVFIDDEGNIAWDRDSTIDSNIHWNNRIDICSDSAYINSTKID